VHTICLSVCDLIQAEAGRAMQSLKHLSPTPSVHWLIQPNWIIRFTRLLPLPKPISKKHMLTCAQIWWRSTVV